MSENKIYSNTEIMTGFAEAENKHRIATESFVKKYGMQYGQHKLMMLMDRMSEEGQVSQRELSKELKVTPAAIAVNLKKLSGFGMIEKIMSEADNRFNFVEFTEKGKETVNESKEKFKELDDLAMEGFTEEEKKILYGYIQRISENLNKASV